jgi:hypothetical protein
MNKLQIKKLGILSVAKMSGLMYFVLSLLISIPYGLIIIFIALSASSSLGRQNGGFMVGGGGVVFGLVIMIALPIIYGLIGFVFGVISALVYNIFAGMVGGIEIEVENVQSY